jgi:hypothetical protein
MVMQPTKSKPTPHNRMGNPDFLKQVSDMGDMLRRNQVSANNGNETPAIKEVDRAYAAFMDSIKDQKEAMKNATEDQKDIFAELMQEMAKLRKDEKADFGKTFEEMKAALTLVHEKGGDQKSKEFLEKSISRMMEHTDKKPKGGILKQEINHRIEKFFKPTASEMDSPLFRHLAGIGKDHSKMISPLEEAKNLGQAEAAKNRLSDDITGAAERDKALEAMAATMGGGKGGAFPSKIENLHVENLIVKNARREEDDHKVDNTPKQITHTPVSNTPVSAPLLNSNPSGPAGAHAVPALPSPKDHQLVEVQNHPLQPSTPGIEHQEGNYLPSVQVHPREPLSPEVEGHARVKPRQKMMEIEDVDFKETPRRPRITSSVPHTVEHHEIEKHVEPSHSEGTVKVASTPKPGNPHVPLRTRETPIAAAVRGAVGAEMAIPQKATIVDAFTPKSDLLDNDIGVRSADATKNNGKDSSTDGDDSKNPDGTAKPKSLLDDAADIAGSVLDGMSGKEEKRKKKTGEEHDHITEHEHIKEPSIKPKSKIMKGLKTAGKLGKGLVKSAAGGVAGALGGMALDYAGDKLEETGHDQLAIGARVASKAADWAGTGAMLGSFVPGVGTAVGAGVGGLAGAADGLYENWDKLDKPEWMGGKPKGKVDTKANHSGEVLHDMSNQQSEGHKIVPVVINAPVQAAPSGGTVNNFVPVKASPRARESYFDRQMMNTFVM